MPLPQENREKLRQAITMQLEALGCDPQSERFLKTPDRVVKLYDEILDGRFAELSNMTSFQQDSFNGAVMVHNVPFYSFCAHHLLMFSGTFAMAYVPNKKVMGLSKLVRVFRHHCKVPTTQETITEAAVDELMRVADAKGAMCWVSAEHTCMTLRGVKSPGSKTTTIAARGCFLDQAELRQQFLDTIKP